MAKRQHKALGAIQCTLEGVGMHNVHAEVLRTLVDRNALFFGPVH
jgi:hypothetical protein